MARETLHLKKDPPPPHNEDRDPDRSIGPTDAHAMADKRLALINAIADSADEARVEAKEFLPEDVETIKSEPVEISAETVPDLAKGYSDPENAEAAPPEPEVESTAVIEPEAVRKFKIRVNGVERELTEEELVERAQKVENADLYLQQAANAVKQAIEAPALPVKDEPPRVDDDDLALARALQMGSEEEAAKAIASLRRPPVTPDDVRRISRETYSLQSVLTSAEDRHKDLLGDPDMRMLFQSRIQALTRIEPDLGIGEAYDRVGKELAAKFGKQAPAIPPEKLVRKASVAPVPSAAARQAAPPDEDAEEPLSDVIAAMAKARRQERPIRH